MPGSRLGLLDEQPQLGWACSIALAQMRSNTKLDGKETQIDSYMWMVDAAATVRLATATWRDGRP
jgi:hypothetical protein